MTWIVFGSCSRTMITEPSSIRYSGLRPCPAAIKSTRTEPAWATVWRGSPAVYDAATASGMLRISTMVDASSVSPPAAIRAASKSLLTAGRS